MFRPSTPIAGRTAVVVVLTTAFVSAPAPGVMIVGDAVPQTPTGLKLLFAVGEPGRQDGQFNEPTDVAFDAAGRLYVVDARNARVQVFDPQYDFLYSFGRFGWEGEGLIGPCGVAADKDLYVYVSDRERNVIHRYDADGKYLKSYGLTRNASPPFSKPSGLAVNKTGDVVVADAGNHKIKRVNLLGEITLEVGHYGACLLYTSPSPRDS